uniref:Uncharacterized protein n=1 Tax=Setaria italica TaxID=4555 RepID=K3ZPK2_SETIT
MVLKILTSGTYNKTQTVARHLYMNSKMVRIYE